MRAVNRAPWRPLAGSLAGALPLVCLPAPAVAQQPAVVGTVIEALGGTPVVGAIVSLRDGEGTVLTRIMVGPGGRFTLQVPRPGDDWTIRVTSLGYAEWASPPIRVTAASPARVDVVVEPAPLAVEGIVAAAELERQCGPLPPDDGSALVRLWERARAGLDLAAWGQRGGGFLFLLRRHEREVDPVRGTVLAERQWDPPAGPRPFVSLPADELNVLGWARQEDPMRTGSPVIYDAPDPEALLSDAFQEAHCFGIRTLEEDPELVAVTFEPERTGPPVGIIGELWMHRETAELRSLAFRFTGYPGFTDRDDGPDLPEATRARLGGEVRFQTLPSGAVVVSEWTLRMPFNTARGVMMRVDGGVLRRTFLPGGAIAPGPLEGLVEGVVRDEAGRPLAGARVGIAGTGTSRVTDAAGRFRMIVEEVGALELEIVQPGQPEGIEPQRVPVRVSGGEVVPVEIPLAGGPGVQRRMPPS